jgi:hypothetical protein
MEGVEVDVTVVHGDNSKAGGGLVESTEAMQVEKDVIQARQNVNPSEHSVELNPRETITTKNCNNGKFKMINKKGKDGHVLKESVGAKVAVAVEKKRKLEDKHMEDVESIKKKGHTVGTVGTVENKNNNSAGLQDQPYGSQ